MLARHSSRRNLPLALRPAKLPTNLVATLATMLTATLMLVGCAAKPERSVIRSTAAMPKSVRVVDAYSRDAYWQRDIEAGRSIEMVLHRQPDSRDLAGVAWQERDARGAVTESGELDVSGLQTLVLVSVQQAGPAQDDQTDAPPTDKPGPSATTKPDVVDQPAPKPDPAASDDDEPVIITITPDGRYFLGKERYDLDDLIETLSGLKKTSGVELVTVRAMRDTPQRLLAPVLEACANLNVRVSLAEPKRKANDATATESPTPKKPPTEPRTEANEDP